MANKNSVKFIKKTFVYRLMKAVYTVSGGYKDKTPGELLAVPAIDSIRKSSQTNKSEKTYFIEILQLIQHDKGADFICENINKRILAGDKPAEVEEVMVDDNPIVAETTPPQEVIISTKKAEPLVEIKQEDVKAEPKPEPTPATSSTDVVLLPVVVPVPVKHKIEQVPPPKVPKEYAREDVGRKIAPQKSTMQDALADMCRTMIDDYKANYRK